MQRLGSDCKAQCRACEPQEHPFAQKLAQDLAAARAHGIAHAELADTIGRADQQQAGHVHHRHSNHQEHHHHDDDQRCAHIAAYRRESLRACVEVQMRLIDKFVPRLG